MPKSVKILDSLHTPDMFNQIAYHPLQSWEWGEARGEMGIEVVRIGEMQDDELINLYQLTFHPIPHTPWKVGYLPRSKMPPTELLDFLSSYGKKNNIIFIKIEPYVEKTTFNSQHSAFNNLTRSSHPLFPEWTQTIDLTQTEEVLLKKMHPKTRYNVGLAKRKGVTVKEMSDDKGFDIFVNLYFETCRRQKYFGHDTYYHKIVWKHLKNKIAHILVAFYQNTPIAAYELFRFHDRSYYPYGGTSLLNRNTMAANLLMWESLRFAKTKGTKIFDMWGSLPPKYSNDHPWAGFTRFKEGFGSAFVQFVGSYDLVINPVLYQLYNILYKLREVYLQFSFSSFSS